MSKLQKIKSFLLENTSTKQTVAKNTFWLFFGEITSRLLKMTLVIYAARMLGAENWGIFSYTITFAAFFMMFSDIGLSPLLTREVAKNPERREQYISTAFFIKTTLLTASLIMIATIAPAIIKFEQSKSLLFFIIIIFLFDALQEFGFSLNRALEKMEKEAIIKIINNFSTAIFGFLFMKISADIFSLAYAYITGSIVGFFLILWTLKSYTKNLFSNFAKNLIKPILYSAWPFALSGLLGVIMLNIDTLMIGWWKQAIDVGFYSAAQRPIQFFYIISNMFATATFPAFARFAQKDSAKFRLMLEKSLASIFLISFPLTIGGIILSQEIIILLFGNQYIPSAEIFKILIITILMAFPAALLNGAMLAHNQQKKFINFMIAGSISNALLNYFLIPIYGIKGAAFATLISQFTSNYYMWFSMKKINYFVITPRLKKIISASLLMTIFSISLKYAGINFIINIALSTIFYFGALAILKEQIIKEIKDILQPKSI